MLRLEVLPLLLLVIRVATASTTRVWLAVAGHTNRGDATAGHAVLVQKEQVLEHGDEFEGKSGNDQLFLRRAFGGRRPALKRVGS